jgi:hypothetical protein
MSIDRDLTSELLRLVRELADQLRPGNDFAQTLASTTRSNATMGWTAFRAPSS